MRYLIMCRSLTYAQRAARVLERAGIGAGIIKAPAGLTGNESTEDITAAMIAQFGSMTVNGLTGTGMTWDASGAVSKDPKAVVIKDGAYAAM